MGLAKDLYDKFVKSVQEGPLLKDDTFLFGTVTSVHPVKVQIDGDTAPADGTPLLMVPDVVVGSRVLCQLHGRQLLVVSCNRTADGFMRWLTDTEHLDNLLETSMWQQSLNVNTSTARGYPVALAGLLEVYRGSNGFAYQRYTTYTGSGVYSRSYYNGNWSGWRTLFSNGIIRVGTFLNGWSNYGSGFDTAGYSLTGGLVKVTGLIKGGTVSTSSTGYAFNLPVGYRPTGTLQFVTNASAGTADVRVTTGGDVHIYGLYSGSNASISLNPISFVPAPA